MTFSGCRRVAGRTRRQAGRRMTLAGRGGLSGCRRKTLGDVRCRDKLCTAKQSASLLAFTACAWKLSLSHTLWQLAANCPFCHPLYGLARCRAAAEYFTREQQTCKLAGAHWHKNSDCVGNTRSLVYMANTSKYWRGSRRPGQVLQQLESQTIRRAGENNSRE